MLPWGFMKKYLQSAKNLELKELKPWQILMIATLFWAISLIFLGRFSSNVFSQIAQPPIFKTLVIPKLLSFSFNWDSGWYYAIASNGYGKAITPVYAFFPLFPLLVNLIHKLGINIVLSSFILNTTATFFALLGLYKLSAEFLNKKQSLLVVLLFMAFPMSFFMFAFYTEALFCALSFWAIYFARKQNWALASVLAMFCGATRLVGLILLVLIALEYLRAKQYNIKNIDKNVLWLMLIPLGLAAFMTYSYIQTGNYLAMFEAYKIGEWTYQKFQPNFILTILRQTSTVWHSGDFLVFIPLVSWLVFLSITILAAKKLPLSYTAYALISLLFFVLNSNVVSVNRYVLPLFSVYIAFVMLLKNKSELIQLAIIFMAIAQGVFLAMFANGFWIG